MAKKEQVQKVYHEVQKVGKIQFPTGTTDVFYEMTAHYIASLSLIVVHERTYWGEHDWGELPDSVRINKHWIISGAFGVYVGNRKLIAAYDTQRDVLVEALKETPAARITDAKDLPF